MRKLPSCGEHHLSQRLSATNRSWTSCSLCAECRCTYNVGVTCTYTPSMYTFRATSPSDIFYCSTEHQSPFLRVAYLFPPLSQAAVSSGELCSYDARLLHTAAISKDSDHRQGKQLHSIVYSTYGVPRSTADYSFTVYQTDPFAFRYMSPILA